MILSQIDPTKVGEPEANTLGMHTRKQSLFGLLITRVFRPSARETLVVVFDQGFLSIGSFLTGLLVARACSKEEYGFYVLGHTLLLTVQVVHLCLVCVPITVHSPHLEGHNHAAYLGSSLIHHLGISGVSTVGFALAAAILFLTKQGHGMSAVLIALSFASVPMLLRDFMRYVLLAQLRVWPSLLMGLAANVAMVGMLSWSYVGGWLTAPLAYIILGGSSGLPVLFVLLRERKRIAFATSRIREDLRRNWDFGRHLLAASVASRIGIGSIPWFVLFWGGSSSVAILGALTAVAAIIGPAILGVAGYLTPKLVHHMKSRGPASAIKAGMKVIAAMSVFAVMYVVFMWTLGEKMVGILYTARYQGHLTTLGIIAISTALVSLSTMLKSLIRAIGKPEIESWSSGCASVVCIIMSISLIPRFGIVGAAIAMSGSNMTFVVVTGLRIAWITRDLVNGSWCKRI